MSTVTRSSGIPITAGGVCYGFAVGVDPVDRVRDQKRAAALAVGVEPDRHVAVVGAAQQRSGVLDAVVQRRGRAGVAGAADMRERLDTEPVGTLHVYAYLSREACDAVALAQSGGRYYHRPAADVSAALAFVRAHGSLDHVA